MATHVQNRSTQKCYTAVSHTRAQLQIFVASVRSVEVRKPTALSMRVLFCANSLTSTSVATKLCSNGTTMGPWKWPGRRTSSEFVERQKQIPRLPNTGAQGLGGTDHASRLCVVPKLPSARFPSYTGTSATLVAGGLSCTWTPQQSRHDFGITVFQAQSDCNTHGSSRLNLTLKRLPRSKVGVSKSQQTVFSQFPSCACRSSPQFFRWRAILPQLVAHPADRVLAHLHHSCMACPSSSSIEIFPPAPCRTAPNIGSICTPSSSTPGSAPTRAASVCWDVAEIRVKRRPGLDLRSGVQEMQIHVANVVQGIHLVCF